MNRFSKSVVAKLLPNENKKAAQAAAQAVAELELVEKRDLLKLTKVSNFTALLVNQFVYLIIFQRHFSMVFHLNQFQLHSICYSIY